jgi:hypothetical protein
MIPPPAGVRQRRTGSLAQTFLESNREPRPALSGEIVRRPADQQVVG